MACAAPTPPASSCQVTVRLALWQTAVSGQHPEQQPAPLGAMLYANGGDWMNAAHTAMEQAVWLAVAAGERVLAQGW